MRKTSRLTMLGLSVISTTALFAGTASAAGDTYAAKANAEALTISIGGTQITGSGSLAELNNDPLATATVTQLLTPGIAPKPAVARVQKVDGTDVAKPETCPHGLEGLEEIPGIVRFDVTCGEASATIAGSLPSARALGAEVVIEPSVADVLSTLGLQEPVADGVNQIFEEALNPLVEAITGNPIGDIADSAVTTVQEVLNDTLTLNSTARVVVAPALAEVATSATEVTSAAHAQGIRVELLPVNELGATNGLLPEDLGVGEPLVTITVGNAFAKCIHNRGTNDNCSKVEHGAAAVSIEFGTTAIGEALGIPTKIEVAPGVEQCVLVGTPLETCVTVAASGVDASGNPYATATSVSLFRGLNGGLDIATGAVSSGSAGAVPAAVAAAPDLPRTGAESTAAIAGAGLLALAVLVRRIAVGRA